MQGLSALDCFNNSLPELQKVCPDSVLVVAPRAEVTHTHTHARVRVLAPASLCHTGGCEQKLLHRIKECLSWHCDHFTGIIHLHSSSVCDLHMCQHSYRMCNPAQLGCAQ